jgi:hypothetical protein
MIEIEHILDEEPIDGQGRDEDLIDILSNTLAHRNPLTRRRSAMSSYNDTGLRQSLVQF